jgi:Trp operon repressor
MNWQYVAGFFDGEGCVTWDRGITKKHAGFSTPTITVSQSGDFRGSVVLERIKVFLREEGIHSRIRPQKSKKRRKPMFNLVVSSRENVSLFLRKVLGAVIVKRTVVQDTLRFLTLYPSLAGRRTTREMYIQEIRKLWNKGMSQRAIAVKYGVTQAAVSKRIIRGHKKFPVQMMFG